jgi:lipopolysaccharide transport system ATP-binding protein
MNSIVISVDHLSKTYRLGQIGSGTLSTDLKVWWAKTRGKPNPLLKIGEKDHGNRDGETIWALKDVSFTVGQGEVLGIIGANGAGKSTLLKILSRVTAPTSGHVKVKGRIASLLEVGTGFHPDLTGRENIYLNGAILGMSKAEINRKFAEIVDFSGVEQFVDTPVKRYSSGMYVRLAFSVAAHLEPEILLVDEVLAVGDAEFQKKCLGKMSNIAGEGRTVLFVSHNMGAIESLCQQVILLQGGRFGRLGDPAEVILAYLAINSDKVKGDGTNLVRHPNRHPGMQEILRRIELSSRGQRLASIPSGSPLTIKIIYELPKFEKDLKFGIGIETSNGVRVVNLSPTQQAPHLLKEHPQQGVLTCEIPTLHLLEGTYNINLFVSNAVGNIDVIRPAMSFTVIRGDVFKTGQTPRSGHGLYFEEAKWKYSKNEDIADRG